jgi:DNA gyrase subunit B
MERAAARRGARYKGWGEMNPGNVGDHTRPRFGPCTWVRSPRKLGRGDLLTLMGDLVEPRRDFIQTNALSVANLDV